MADIEQLFPTRSSAEPKARRRRRGGPRPPNGSLAHSVAGEMESDVARLRRWVYALKLASEGCEVGREGEAIFAIADAMETAVDKLETKRAKIQRETRGYAKAE